MTCFESQSFIRISRVNFSPREFARNVIGGHVGKNALYIPVFFVAEPVYFASIEIPLDAVDTQTAAFTLFTFASENTDTFYIFLGGKERNSNFSTYF